MENVSWRYQIAGLRLICDLGGNSAPWKQGCYCVSTYTSHVHTTHFVSDVGEIVSKVLRRKACPGEELDIYTPVN